MRGRSEGALKGCDRDLLKGFCRIARDGKIRLSRNAATKKLIRG